MGVVMAYADDTVIVADERATLQMTLMFWEDILNTKGLKRKKARTEVMKLARKHEDLNI